MAGELGSVSPACRAMGVDRPTYYRLGGRRSYFAAVHDACSRRIVGWAMADRMRAELVVDALQMALARAAGPLPGLIDHSDQGSQFVSLAFGQQARDARIAVSMGSRGDAYDHAVAESLFATREKELIRRHSRPTRRELIGEVFDIEAFYNSTRRHSTLGYLSRAQVELRDSQSEPETSHHPGEHHLTNRVGRSVGTPHADRPP